MRNLYVTELTTLNDGRSVSEVIEEHGQDTWTLEDVSELIEYLDNNGFSLDEDEKGIEVHINDFDELAFWSLNHGLREYDEVNTVDTLDSLKPDISYQGQDYKFVFLVEDIMADFLSDAIDDIKDLDSFPTGIGIDKYDV